MAERILQDIAEQKKRLTKAQISKNTAEKADAYYNLGTAYYFLEDFHRAIEYLKQYLSIAEEVGDRAGAGRAYCHLGWAYQSLGDSQRAIEYHNQHISIAKEIGERAEEGCGYTNLGDAYESLREFQRAIEYHNQHLSIAKEVGNRACQGKALAKLGFAYCSLNEFQRAIEYNNKYLIIAKEAGDRAGQGQGYGILGNIYLVFGEYQRALEYTNKSLIIAKEDGNRAMEGEAYSVLGPTYLKLNEFERAMECHKKQLSIANEVGDRRGKGLAYLNIGEVHNSLGDVPRAMEYYKQSLRNAEEIGDRDGQGHAYCHLGSCYARLHDFKEAIECYKQHLRISEEIGDRKAEACAHVGLGQSFLHSYSLNEALEHFRCSVKVYDTIRASSISEDELKISFRTQHQFAYTYLWYVLVMLERNDEALYAAERGRAQALLDALKVTYGLTSPSPRSIESEEEVRNISRKTTALTVFLALHLKTVNIWVLGKEGNPIFRQAEIEIGCEHEDSFTLLLDTVLKNIRDGVGIRCENRSMDKLSDDSTPSSTREDNQTSEPSQETTDFLQPLYDAVLGPIEDLLDGDELIVVPDGALCLAPWAALRESLRIRMVPSLRSLEVITDSPCEYHSQSGALIVGDPCLEKVTNKWGNPIYEQLKYARMEVEMIGEILESQPLTGKDATKEAVLQRIASVALVHIAAHGRKETGEIVLAPNPQSGSKPPTEEDYILKMSDIQAVRLRARLVVLSCAHSGQGKVSSEGVVGMARAFLFAGARSVLAALWAIDDEATMMFMKSFYQQLGSGEIASVALQRAMKCLRDSHDFSAPRYWAPFVLIGDDVKIELKKKH
ncbi:tetratricopeptide repeat protein 28-like isoform X2 [Porites lutea]|uniref:tetratricopeptide repeat protein 28-like isoform X2 n=1 Tax=Porites lutea TaxID=51062 RepID=UPI003CC5F7F6